MQERLPDAILAAQLRRPHGELATTISASMSRGNAALIQQTYQLPPLSSDAHVLELGMGNGQHLPALLARLPTGHITGIDYSPEMVAEATALYANQDKLHFQVGQLGCLPLATASMDAIFSINTLYFWDDIEACIQDLYRVLRPKGTLNLGIRTRHAMEKVSFTRQGFQCYTRDEAIALFKAQQRFHLWRLDYTPKTQGQFATMDALSLCFQHRP